MKILKTALAMGSLLGAMLAANTANANTLVVDGTLLKLTGGTTFDTWKLNVTVGGAFSVDVMAYEASQSNVSTAGYFSSDLNGDGELTWLDPDTYFYTDDGHLDATDALVRCDDVANNCPVYQNGNTSVSLAPILTISTHSQAEASQDGSIHFRRDPWYDMTLAAGNYLYVIADFRLDPAEAAGGINANDNFSAPTGFTAPILDHADYRVTFSSSTLDFSLSGDTITVTAAPVPIPAAAWLFASALAGLVSIRRRR